MHDNNSFCTPRRNGENIKFKNIITKSQQRPHNITRIIFCEPEQEIRFTIVALEHQEARGVTIEGEWVFYMRGLKEIMCLG